MQFENFNKIWGNICKHEGETFLTPARKKSYTYVVKDEFIIVNDGKGKKIKRIGIEKALNIDNVTRAKIQDAGVWGSSYVYGIITDKRIL